MREKLIIEKYFNQKEVYFDEIDSPFIKNDMQRLINIWDQYNANVLFKIDFEITLRDFLIKIKDSIVINGYNISDFGTKYLGLSINNNVVTVSANYPNYINKKHVYDSSCIQEMAISKKVDCVSLETSEFVRNLTGFQKYKSCEQKICVLSALSTPNGYTSLISMSTGGGKSLVTQTVSYQKNGLTIIVVPTISLMIDQVNNARSLIKTKDDNEITYYNSDSNAPKIAELIDKNIIKMLFISPEALIKNKLIINSINEACKRGVLNNLVIDEAHIVVEWGASFRVDFQCIEFFRKKLLVLNPNLRTFLLSATFSRDTVALLKNAFGPDYWLEVRCDSLRKEPRYSIIQANNYNDKINKTIELIAKLPHPMIVYVQSPNEANNLQELLINNGINNTRVFTGKTNNSDRIKIIEDWTNSYFDIMIATCAFGVGVDKKDVRTVLHLYVPDNPNKFYQEAGRGGRDGYPCLSVLLYTYEDIDSAFGLTQKALTIDKLYGRWFSMIKSKNTKIHDGIVWVDTTTKPNYSENDDNFDFANKRDVNWNIYVILMLKRNNVIDVTDAIVDLNGHYYFEVKVLYRELLQESSISKCLLDNVRTNEWSITEKQFNKIKKMIMNISSICIAETFCEVYNLADELCSGCNSHEKLTISNSNIVLKKKISYLPNQFSNFKDNIIIVIDSNVSSLLGCICDKMDTIIINDNDIQIITQNPNLNRFVYKEFSELIDNATLLFKQKIVLVMEDNQIFINKALELIKKCQVNYKMTFIIACGDDFFVEKYQKKLSEIVQGQIVDRYILKEVMQDV